MKQLTDTDPMPWGKYGPTGEKLTMEKVPADYLFWLWTEGGKERDMQCPIADYIRRNLNVLKTEHPDGIWETK